MIARGGFGPSLNQRTVMSDNFPYRQSLLLSKIYKRENQSGSWLHISVIAIGLSYLGSMMRKFSFILLLLLAIESEGSIYPKSVLQAPRFLVLSGDISDWDGGNSTGLGIGYSFLRKSGLTSRVGLNAYVDFKEYDIYAEYKKTVSDSSVNPTLGGSIYLSDDTQLGESGLYWAYSVNLSYRFSSSDFEVPSTGQMLAVRTHDVGTGFYSDLNFPINFPDNSISIAPYIGFYSYFIQSYSEITNVDINKSESGLGPTFGASLKLGIDVRILDLFYVGLRRIHPFNNDYVPTVGFSVFRPFIF